MKTYYAYYNDNDPYVVEWTKNLIGAGLIPRGDVDGRSIKDVQPEDLDGYTQCHFFCGINGWPLAFRMAGWADSRPVWSGSCPCQPFSVAGKRQGDKDSRHLWPEFYRLIQGQSEPLCIFGEQVSGADGHKWLAGVQTDLAFRDYRLGAVDIPACSVQAPHIRSRLYWVADTIQSRLEGGQEQSTWQERQTVERGGDAGRLADSQDINRGRTSDKTEGRWRSTQIGGPSAPSRLAVTDGKQCTRIGREGKRQRQTKVGIDQPSLLDTSFWSAYSLIPCEPGVVRRVEPGTFPLAHGVSRRMDKLCAIGNAVVPQVAAQFIRAYMECADTDADA